MGAYLETTGSPQQRPERANISVLSAPRAEEVRAALTELLASQTFRVARAQRNFLHFVVEQTLAGRGETIKEYSIGVEVFGRGKSFDPRANNIVRAEANRLRSKLAKYYETEGKTSAVRIDLPKGGYTPVFLAAPAHEAPRAAIAAEQPDSVAPHFAHNHRRKIAAIFFAVVLAGAYATAVLWRTHSGNVGSPEKPSIVVLPFRNVSDNKENEFFSDGLTDELIDGLGRVPTLNVVARTSAFEFKGKTLDVRQIGRRLNVRTVLEGTVRRYGDRLRITAQLDDAVTGYRMWSESYDRDARDALAIQREISQAITGALGVALASNAGTHNAKVSTGKETSVSPEAYEDYLKGVFFWNKNTPEGIRIAIDHFEQAVSKDPGFALPYLGLARCYAGLTVLTSTPALEVTPKIRASARKALDLDSTLGEAHIDLAEAYTFDFDWTAAEQEFRKALELSPGSAVAHRWYAYYLTKMGRLEEALAENKRALELDPVSPYVAQGIADALYTLRRYDASIAQSQKVLSLEPNFAMTRQALGMTFVLRGKYPQGLAELKAARQLLGNDPWADSQLGYAYAVSGHREQARQILNQLLAQTNSGRFPALVVAQVYIGLNDQGRAFAWLRKAVDNHEVQLKLRADPIYDPLRSDPRFSDLLRRMKLL